MDRLTRVINSPAMLALMAVLLWMLQTIRRVTRREGVVMLAAYRLGIAALVGLGVCQSRS